MEFDIVIIGGGHAGLEAAWISSQFSKLNVGLVSMPGVPLGSTPCNPAVGGVGKGQVVREIDALGGIMGKLADLAGIQYRVLNESKGYAVRSTRIQVDKDKYAHYAEQLVLSNKNIKLVRKKVSSITKADNLFTIVLSDNSQIFTKALVVTTGTFLNGTLHTGGNVSEGGRVGSERSKGLQDLFSNVQKLPIRFKTGTPPRLNKDTINFSKLIEQKTDPKAINFHWDHETHKRNLPQHSCFLTKTNSRTLSTIRDNKEKSPLFNGQIKGVGPRYCPSIEDKAFRYPNRNQHHVFIEPEGLDTVSIYPNGISTSLPIEIQEEFIQSIEGLEEAEILVPGYAVEYDVVDTTQLKRTLEHKDIDGLYFAGQVNGTSGYEEAGGQGLIAGVNAALTLLNRDPLILSRSESYIGVMVDDLVGNRRDEPYRLFTARNENRLFVREDNTIIRIAPYRKQLGLNLEIDKYQYRFIKQFTVLSRIVRSYVIHSNNSNKRVFEDNNYGPLKKDISLSELIKRSQLDPVETLENETRRLGCKFLFEVIQSVAITEKYSGYINRSKGDANRLRHLEDKRINYDRLIASSNISTECKQRIKSIRPETFGQLKRIDGIRPATLVFVANHLV